MATSAREPPAPGSTLQMALLQSTAIVGSGIGTQESEGLGYVLGVIALVMVCLLWREHRRRTRTSD